MIITVVFMATTTSARELFQTTFERRYTWDENFPGYSADVEVVYGSGVYKGKARVDHNLNVEVNEVNNQDVKEGIYTQLLDLVTHRKCLSFEDSHGEHEFILGDEDDSGAVEIAVKGDTMNSRYKIRGQEICQVSRVMGSKRFVIDTYSSLDTGSGYIATAYDATFYNTQTNEIEGIIKFEDSYEKFGDYYLMLRQVLQEYKGGVNTTTEFKYSNIKLLGGE
jgi:Protein of unknown function (DUF3386)